MHDPAQIAAGLSEAEKERLLEWPALGSTFEYGPDDIALGLCQLSIGAIMPWDGPKGHNRVWRGNRLRQMGLTPLGLAVRRVLEGR